MILGNGSREEARAYVDRVDDAVRASPELELVGVDLSVGSDLSDCPADAAVVVGGDGTVMHAVRRMGNRPIPIIGVNAGRLGFLADLTLETFLLHLPDLATRRFTIDNLMTMSVTLASPRGPTRAFHALNDAVVRAAPYFRIVEIGLSIDGESVMNYRGDGLIVATPAGSTAHSLSAGGPILPPLAHMFVVTPICAHTLTQRPLVDGGHKTYEMIPRGDGVAMVLIVDGQIQVPVQEGDRLTIRRGDAPFPIVRLPGHSFYHTLRDKLGWGAYPAGDRGPRT